MRRDVIILPTLALLGACTTAVPQSAPAPPPRQPISSVPATDPAPPTAPSNIRQPQIMRLPGLETVIGSNESALTRQFGAPRLNVIEGDVRKLQFSGEACVLDIYLYPQNRGAEPVATWVEARRSSDGLDVDRASCVAALRRR